jgi:hypothetical protein
VIVSSLSSPEDAEVLSALDLLETYDKRSLVSPLILHHPSSPVVLRALELLARSDHPHLGPQIEALLGHRDPAVRAAALHHHAARGADPARVLRVVHEDPSPAVRATALLLWIAPRDRAAASRLVEEILGSGDRDARLALARALPSLPPEAIGDAPRRLVADPDAAFAAEIAQAAIAAPKTAHVPLLLELLARREARPTARAALRELGDDALVALAAALEADDTPEAVRRHLPRTISRFESAHAVAILVRAAEHGAPRVRYKALRGLGRLRANAPALPLAREPIERVAETALQRAVTMLHYGVAHAVWSELHPPARDEEDLLGPLLVELERRALEHAFRALHVLDPEQEYDLIFDALRRGRASRAGSRELLEHRVEGRFRDAMLAMLDASPPLERLRETARFFAPDGSAELLALLRASSLATASGDERDRLDVACRSVLAAIDRDPDAVLVSVARLRLHPSPAADPQRKERHVA